MDWTAFSWIWIWSSLAFWEWEWNAETILQAFFMGRIFRVAMPAKWLNNWKKVGTEEKVNLIVRGKVS